MTLFEAIGLVVIVMFLFLQNWRTHAHSGDHDSGVTRRHVRVREAFGFSINTLTLFGITLATGLVVDDAIVVIENIERHIHDYAPPRDEAASDAMAEVTSAVIATALVLAAVFVPVAFFPGTTGRLYQQFALTIAFSMAHFGVQRAHADAGALGAAPARRAREANWAFRQFNRGIDGGTAGWSRRSAA